MQPEPPTPLNDLLLREASARGVAGSETPSRERAFELVREMPYLRASDREPTTTIREWRGTCSGKHYLLRALLAELGVETDLIACTTYVEVDASRLPARLAAVLGEGPVPDVHNYLRAPWVIDATWPLATARYGLPVNPEWTEGVDMLLPCTPTREVVVPPENDPQAFKERLLKESFTEAELERRSRFFGLLAGREPGSAEPT